MNTESEIIRNSIEKIAREESGKQNRSAFRVYKAVVKTAPSFITNLCGVSLMGDETVLNLPFTKAVWDVAVGDIVLVATTFNNFTNAIVWAKPDLNFGVQNGTVGYELVGNGITNAPVWRQPTGFLLCGSSGPTTVKTVTHANFKLATGTVINVKFSYAHTSSTAARLNVNSTGSYLIEWNNTGYTITAGTNSARNNSWQANEVLTLVFDGSIWRILARSKPIVYSSSGSVAAVYNDFVEIAYFQAAAGKVYSITANIQSNVAIANGTMGLYVEVYTPSGTQIAQYVVRGFMNSGGGISLSVISSDALSQSNSVYYRLKAYGYENATYNYYGYIRGVSVVE